MPHAGPYNYVKTGRDEAGDMVVGSLDLFQPPRDISASEPSSLCSHLTVAS